MDFKPAVAQSACGVGSTNFSGATAAVAEPPDVLHRRAPFVPVLGRPRMAGRAKQVAAKKEEMPRPAQFRDREVDGHDIRAEAE